MDFNYSAEEQAFRQEVRGWIKDNVHADWGSSAWPIPEDEAAKPIPKARPEKAKEPAPTVQPVET